MTNIKEMEYFFITLMEKNMQDNFKKVGESFEVATRD